MIIDFEKEIKLIIPRIKLAEDYLSCEDVIINNLKMHLNRENDMPAIENYIRDLYTCFNDLVKKNSGTQDCIKYIYASSFLKVLTESAYWHSWIMGLKNKSE